MLINKQTIENQENFVIKWAETPYNSEEEGVASRYAFQSDIGSVGHSL